MSPRVATGQVGQIVVEFVRDPRLGPDGWAVNICRSGTDECTRLTADEWTMFCQVAQRMRAVAHEIPGFQWLPGPWAGGRTR